MCQLLCIPEGIMRPSSTNLKITLMAIKADDGQPIFIYHIWTPLFCSLFAATGRYEEVEEASPKIVPLLAAVQLVGYCSRLGRGKKLYLLRSKVWRPQWNGLRIFLGKINSCLNYFACTAHLSCINLPKCSSQVWAHSNWKQGRRFLHILQSFFPASKNIPGISLLVFIFRSWVEFFKPSFLFWWLW